MTQIKTISITDKGQICIPKDMRNEANIKEGEQLVLIAKKGILILKKSSEILKELEESIGTMIASEESLKKDWDNEKDDRWNKY
mgnify:CR=1 FL=1